MQITETVCRSVIKLEAADLNGSLYERSQYTSAARCWAGDLAKAWIEGEKERAELREKVETITDRLDRAEHHWKNADDDCVRLRARIAELEANLQGVTP